MSTALLLAADSSDSSDDGSYVANEESESDDEIEEPAAPEIRPPSRHVAGAQRQAASRTHVFR